MVDEGGGDVAVTVAMVAAGYINTATPSGALFGAVGTEVGGTGTILSLGPQADATMGGGDVVGSRGGGVGGGRKRGG